MMFKKHVLVLSKDKKYFSHSLHKLFLRAYGFDSFKIDSHFFSFPDVFKSDDNPSLENYMYDSCFYTLVSMFLTRSERDKFIKLFRRSY